MRDSLRTAPVRAALAVACACWGCAASPSVSVVQHTRDDFSGSRTWDWIDGRAVVVRAPAHDGSDLEERLAELVARELSELGLERAPGNAELRVAALLVARPQLHAVRRPTALQTLHSFHDSTYEVQAEVTELRPVDRLRLSVYVTASRQERLLWQAQLDERYEGGFAPHLDDAIARLLRDFPPGAAARSQAP